MPSTKNGGWYCRTTSGILCFLILAFADLAHAGSEIIDKTVYIDGLPLDRSVAQGEIVKLCYNSTRYIFSGRRNEYVYTVFMISPRIHISGSVGRNGNNNYLDVKTIKRALSELRYYDGPLDGEFDDSLVWAISRFQREVTGQVQDGRIDVGGKTIQVLRIETSDRLFINLTERIGHNQGHRQLRECVNFIAPNRVIKYDISYCELSLITDYSIGTEIVKDGKEITVLNASEERFLKKHLLQYAYSIQHIGSLNVVSRETYQSKPFTTYLKVNGKALVLETKVTPGFSERPLRFSWFVEPEYHGETQYRYRLSPQKEDWSPWSEDTETKYYFVTAGTHTFEVGTRYKDKSSKWREVPRLVYEFTLNRAFVSKPIIKADLRASIDRNTELPALDRVYGSSKALLVGIGEFQDWESFKSLDYVKQDIAEMEKALKGLGFDVRTLQGKVKRADVLMGIDELIESANTSDRIVIYFSTHGFSDTIVKSRAYIAPYDCRRDAPTINCIELDNLENMLQRVIEKPVKHLIVILDACSAGLGLITKDVDYKEIRIAMKNGAHMLTAGMADQKAHMERQIQMSIFTYYLTRGLAGEADLIKDDVISLSELLLYVRYQVAKSTDGAQTPMMGRLSGAGEMIFKIR